MSEHSFSLPGLAGKNVVVTGAASGQGLAETTLLLRSGANVWATDLAQEPPATLASLAAEFAGSLHYHPLDVADEAHWKALAASIKGRASKFTDW